MKIFITHMHGDHVLGLPGLLQTMSLLDRQRELEIYGPVGIKAFVKAIEKTVQFVLTFRVEIHEIRKEGIACTEKEYEVLAGQTDHVTPSWAYALLEKPRPGRFDPKKAEALGIPEGPLWSKLQHGEKVKMSKGKLVKPEQVVGVPRPGRKIVYSGDTRPTTNLLLLAERADLLIHEATFENELEEKAIEDGHSTPAQAAKIAKKAKVKRLVLTHVSSRYKNPKSLLEQAKRIFPKSEVAEDLMEIDVPLEEP
jgi:ribonuclease Z